VYGSKDAKLGLESAGNLRNLANQEIHVMEDAGHACYLNNPDEWHMLLYNFLLALD
jgi:abhydrolase domain-containing protein 14